MIADSVRINCETLNCFLKQVIKYLEPACMTVKTEDTSTVLTVCQSVLGSRFSLPISLLFKICICPNNKYQLSRKVYSFSIIPNYTKNNFNLSQTNKQNKCFLYIYIYVFVDDNQSSCVKFTNLFVVRVVGHEQKI